MNQKSKIEELCQELTRSVLKKQYVFIKFCEGLATVRGANQEAA
jgi:hypothetical protein